jgi:hypothetical protein
MRTFIAAAALSLCVAPAQARVTSIAMGAPTPLFDGRSLGAAGAYEQLRGTVSGELDPLDPHNAVITDINLAQRNANGRVPYTATFTLHRPVSMANSSGVMVYEVVNRGNKILPLFFTVGATTAKPEGDAFMYRNGNLYLWSGWQGDIAFNPALATESIQVPSAPGVTGPTFARFVGVSGTTRPLPGAGRNPVLSGQAKLISIAREDNRGVRTGVTEIPRASWSFGNCTDPNALAICYPAGFDPNLIYELTYTAKDPFVLGVGMAAMRDVSSFFRYSAQSPVAGRVDHTVAYGISQSGRYTKNFILLGFNEDEDGRIVWDGADSNIAGAMGQFNIRFAQPGNIANIFEPGAEAPMWWAPYNDTARGRGVHGILDRCSATRTCPKIFEDFGGAEIWYGRGGIGIAGTRGNEDIPVPANVRRYYYASTPHGGGAGGFSRITPPAAGLMLASNPNPQLEQRRALFLHLVEWVKNGTPPPPSSYPRVTDGTLVAPTAAAMGWPAIPGAPTPDNVMNVLMDYDYGPDFRYNDQSGVMSNVVPPIKQIIPTLAGKVDEDGNEVAGLKSVLLQAPLGTYTSWNPVAAGPLKGNEGNLAAGYIPFALTKAERKASGDPRRSVEERYGSQEGYVCAVRIAAAKEEKKGLLLAEDADRLIAQAAASSVLPSNPNDKTAQHLCKRADKKDDR